MVSFEDVRKIALGIEGVEEGTSYGTPALKVRGKLVVRLREDGDSLVVGTTFEERDAMMADDPATYYITDHYLNYPWVLVRMSRVNREALRDLIQRACKLVSSKSRTR